MRGIKRLRSKGSKWVMAASLIVGLISILFTSQTAQAAGTTYYVSPNGNNSNGLSPQTAFRTLQQAANITNPGDTVLVMSGTYTDTNGGDILTIPSNRSGTANAYITYKAAPGEHPVLRVQNGAWNHISVRGAAYIKIEGLEIYGMNESLSYSEAQSYENNGNLAYISKFNTNGIYIVKDGNAIPHHIELRNNIVHEVPGMGMGSQEGDYITIEDNIVYNNCFFNAWATSGISVFHLTNTDLNTGYKNVVRRNLVYNNINNFKWQDQNMYSDGNGIIIDDNRNTQINGTPYVGRTLVENNIVANNGGAGINIYSSRFVDVVNNTAYGNSKSVHLNYGEMIAGDDDDVRIFNNILYANGKNVNAVNNSTNTVFANNIYYNGTVNAQGTNNITANPQLVNPAGLDFHLYPSSPAVNAGSNTLIGNGDYEGNRRPIAGTVDIGAYEYENLLTNPGFEFGTNNRGAWGDWGNSSIVNNNANAGNNALRVGKGAGGTGQEITSGFTAGDSFILTAAGKVSTAGEQGWAGIKFFNAAGNQLYQADLNFNTTAYTFKSLNAVIPSGTTKIQVYAWKDNGSGYLYLDDYALIRENLNNPGFELGASNRGGWGDWGNSYVVGSNAQSGSYSLQVSSGYGGAGQNISSGFKPGGNVTVTASGKVSVNGEQGWAGVIFYDTAGTNLGSAELLFNTTSYQTKTITAQVPPGTAVIQAYAWKNNGPGTLYVDDYRVARN